MKKRTKNSLIILLWFACFPIYGLQVNQSDSVEQKFYELTRNLIKKYNSDDSAGVASNITELKNLIPLFTHNWNYPNAVHKVNIVSGRIALKAGDVELAKKYLIEAGNAVILPQLNTFGSNMSFGSPQLKTFGPNMSLAKELLEKGEREIVLDYFQLCRKVWNEKIDEWTDQIKRGEIPDFGGNLFY